MEDLERETGWDFLDATNSWCSPDNVAVKVQLQEVCRRLGYPPRGESCASIRIPQGEVLRNFGILPRRLCRDWSH